ncbi:MAG TPA: bifunctional methylenetetrahydrofolate dehydrogenase/methenyltetrahydrofolate cyclohydrolase FolD [Candidatus Competibacteraceae bacterium]|nr:bifunctional methylenetetrahydrofolate dehydrogenase/methenyltetrahydrofolate cyclohydrolase FolD [Candidatus Competibacteraceae bacterium]HRZ07498.1 bifunctional methylenetetrahydrofolate dehydrogenase/methenyltetrahydrofolate cyclohydrolase FolD [Candidatus Competibacteraceae bacterium]HSA47056.1 bifunctional methylenetetrahydrofolate dehydrogenase/methenyltetrahydrofolate cyclohydrolase FolD [Candidatus Competibacteraceae bacterium]
MATATIIDGKRYAARLRAAIAVQIAQLKADHSLTPGLAVVLVGDDPASQIYVRNKGLQAREAGMHSFEYRLPATATQAELLARIAELNQESAVNGILVQLPLPKQIDPEAVIAAIAVGKDVDGFHPLNAGLLAVGGTAMVPCTPLGCLMLLKDYAGPLAGQRAVVLGRSNIVGKPMAALLLREHCTVTLAHSRTRDLAEECRRADILVAAVGKAQMVKGDWIKPGATVIDVGINRIPTPDGKGRLAGDVDFASAVEVAGAITPVPGGVGPMTIACLLLNTLTATCRQQGIPAPDVRPAAE